MSKSKARRRTNVQNYLDIISVNKTHKLLKLIMALPSVAPDGSRTWSEDFAAPLHNLIATKE